MENETNQTEKQETQTFPVRALLPIIIISAALGYIAGLGVERAPRKVAVVSERETKQEEIVLPVRWGDLGVKMTSAGVIDRKKFEALYERRGGLDAETKKLLFEANHGNLKITEKNSGVLLNLLWALGLGNKNDILETGPMKDPRYGGAENFASTGGWTLSDGNAMRHYSAHQFIVLTAEQQKLVERVSKNIYRPCCDNPTYFPDCNHGIAMLGLLELMASQGVSEKDMYKTALQVNVYWFPDNYLIVEKYLASKGTSWEKADPKEILGAKYSSGSGYRKILQEVGPPPQQGGGGGCGVDAGAQPAQQQDSGGCGV